MFHNKFREIAKLYPDSPAIVCQDEVMSYRELDVRSDEIASELSAQGIGPGSLVPIQRELDAEWIANCIGIMKSGAAYVPISASTPPERTEFIFRNINVTPGNNVMLNNGDAMAVYYTSGSTGAPKGTVLSHTGMLAFCETHCALFGFTPGIRGSVQADVGFDSFLLTTLPILYTGGILYLMGSVERTSLIGIHRFMMKNKIESAFFTTQLAIEYMRTFDNRHLKVLLTGGEALRMYTLRSYAVYNLYGPTECTIYVTAHKLNADDSGDIPIGAPTGRNRIYIMDGEVCISGPQVGLGYLNRPDETAKRFVPNPNYDPSVDETCYLRMYRTGDLAELADNGELLYRGRIDNQVKISGYRIEPGEIEVALAKHPDLLAACVAVKRNPNGEAFLAAYCVPHIQGLSPDTLKTFLTQSLPAYMIPRKFTMLEKLPVDVRTGKVDISALPE